MSVKIKTQVGIIGAGPAGLLLGRILQSHGIDTVILERRSRDYVLSRVRAGVLEQGTVDTLKQYGLGDRLSREGLPIETMQLRWDHGVHVVPIKDERGRRLTTYGQQKIVEDLILQREADALPLHFETSVESLDGIETSPVIHFRDKDGQTGTLECDYIAGCDGFRGVSRGYIPGSDGRSFLKEYPFAWLGVLVRAAPRADLRGFSHSTRGLGVASARSADVGRLYLQVPPEMPPEQMSDEEIWNELDLRLDDSTGNRLNRGPIFERSVARLRAFVCEAMRHGKLCIAGDAAHIVPPSGAKGLNLAVGDARVLAEAFRAAIQDNDTKVLDSYSEICLRRVWPTVHWSCLMCEAFHMFPGQTDFDTRMQYQTLSQWANTEIGQIRFRDAQLGLPFQI
jgi:p-hydroxybenzoate 3-monooxygenase